MTITIVAIAETACRLTNEYDELYLAKQEAERIAAIFSELEEIRQKVVRLATLCSFLDERLPIRNIRSEELPKILADVQNAHAKFMSERVPLQTHQLQNIAGRLQQLLIRIEQEWKGYVKSQIWHYLNL